MDKAALLRGPPVENSMMLPIESRETEIVNAVKHHQVVVVMGETGSGKTTRIPIFLYRAGFAKKGIIGITEPRRIAATSVARYVAEGLGSQLGDLVGYQVRFDNKSEKETAVKFMTDGILLREFQIDPDLSKYSVIMVDEAHERSQNIDFTLGLLKDLLKRRSDLRVVVASATIDTQKFSQYFGSAPIIEASGRVYPVETIYERESIPLYDNRYRFTMDFMATAVAEKVTEICRTTTSGDVLVFMSGKDDISMVIEKVEARRLQNLVLLPAYGGLSADEQAKIFQAFPGKRKVVVATNIAETSITIDNIAYVVDSGIVKQNHFHPETGIQSLDFVCHSRAGCDQRKGRAGRTRPGKCFRMYPERDFAERPAHTEPEIRRVSIAGVVLAMEDIGITEIESFDFIDPPDREAFHEAYQTLIALGAITQDKTGITDIGRQMVRLPLEPRIARMVIEAQKHGCVKEIATIASFLSVPQIYARPKGKEHEADMAHRLFKIGKSDLLSFLLIWRHYEESGFSNDWCYKNYLNSKSLSDIVKIRNQLFGVLQENGIELSEENNHDIVLKSATAGLIYNLLESSSWHSYAGVLRQSANNVFVHPGSTLFYGAGNWIVATDIMRTTKLFARNCTQVQLSWLRELLPNLFSEEAVLVSLGADGNSVLARKKILFKRHGQFREVGSEETIISIPEARRIQDDAIAQAREKGWREVTFTSKDHTNRLYGDGYCTYSYDTAEVGVSYYCEISRLLGRMYAVPKLRLFNLPSSNKKVPTEMTLTFGGASLKVNVKS